MRQEVYFGAGAITRVGRVLDRLNARRVLVVRGKGSYAASGAERLLEPCLRGRSVGFFSNFRENPRFEDVLAGLAVFTTSRCEAVVAVGGGTVLDMAKLLTGLATASDPLKQFKIVGYFPTYSLGNLYASQFFEQAAADLGDLDAMFAAFDPRGEIPAAAAVVREGYGETFDIVKLGMEGVCLLRF